MQEHTFKLPSNAFPMKTHRRFAPELAETLGDSPSLWRWRSVFITQLQKKIHQNRQNVFLWKDYWLTIDEIVRAVTETTYHYGMQRMGYEA